MLKWVIVLPVLLAAAQDTPAPTFVDTLPATTVSWTMVRLPSGLWMSATEVTWDLFDVFLFRLDEPEDLRAGTDAFVRPSHPHVHADRGYGHAGYPVISVSGKSAEAFCTWLSAKTGKRYRLPTEAEWQSACEQGQASTGVEEHAWVKDNAARKTHPAASKPADALGLHDLLGNAAEWCTADDGTLVVRGGSFKDKKEDVGCARRDVFSPAWQMSDPQIPKSRWWLADGGFLGFRLVCETDTDR